MRGVRLYAVVCCAVVLALFLPVSFPQSPAPVLSVDAAANNHPIDPNIYGIASFGLDPQFAAEIRVPNVRWGGDTTTRYNWLVDSSDMGLDWFFVGGCSNAKLLGFPSCGQTDSVPGYSVDQMISTFGAAGARPLVTIPIIPYVNRSATQTCSFPVSEYGPQQGIDSYDHPDGQACGNGISLLGGKLTDNDVYSNHVDNTTSLQQGWLEHLIATFGTAANGGVPYYQLDNEPYGWFNTHHDVMPAGANYPQIAALGEEYAAMIKQSDPSAKVFGPSDFSGLGWIGDPRRQNGLFAGQYYLQQMAAYQQSRGRRILDYFDEHYYASSFDDASELASTRTLWDPTYLGLSGSPFNAPIELIPRFHRWIEKFYPGTKLSISEYGFSKGRNWLVDGLTEADVLGIFGREQVDFANLWTIPMPPPPVLAAFRIFRNYDGQGGEFGNISVQSSSSDQGRLSVYGALRSGDHALTVLVINKTTRSQETVLSLANFSGEIASVYSFSGADLSNILRVGDAGVVSNQIDYDFPPYSATLFVIPESGPQVAETSTTLSASSLRPRAGQAVTFRASAAPSVAQMTGAGAPTGTIEFVNDQTVLATVPVSSGTASFTTAALSSGLHTVTAMYSGDANYDSSVSGPLEITVTAARDYSLDLSDSTLQIKKGSDATITITVTPHDGFAAPVAFGCTGLPAGGTCSFDPSTVTPRGAPVTTTMTIALGTAASAAINTLPSTRILNPLLWLWIAVPAFLLLLGTAQRKSKISRVARAFRLAALAGGCSLLFGCAFGANSSISQTSSEAQNTYVISVNAGGINVPAHSRQFTLTIVK